MNRKKSGKKKPIAVIIAIFVLTLLYLTINNVIYIEKYVREIFYYPFKNINSKNSIELMAVFESELRKENEELRALMNITNSLENVSLVNATVITRNTNEWLDFFTINKGSADGILEGMAVIDCGGLIGKVKNVSKNSAVIELLTSSHIKNKTSVKILYGEESLNAVMENDGENRLVILGISKNIETSVGDKVITSGLSDKLPNGIIIGHVEEITYDTYKTSKKLYIKPVYPMDDVRYVAVIVTGDDR